MEGSDNPDNLEALWEQSKAKKLWDDSLKLDQHISQTHSAEDSIPIKDYISRWCNVVQIPYSPTPQDDHCMPHKYSSEENDNLDKYDEFINELSVRVKGGWTPADHVPYNEDLLRHTLGFSPRVKQDKEVYPVSDIKRNRLAPQLDLDSTSTVTIKGERQSVNLREK